jgi:hypothetical protein
MRIHIQDCRTRKFLRDPLQWIEGAGGARNFSNSMDAFRHCIDLGLAGVNIFVDRGAHRQPLIIPVDPVNNEVATERKVLHAPAAWD